MRLWSVAVAVSLVSAPAAAAAQARVTAPASLTGELPPPLPPVSRVVDRLNDLFRSTSSESRLSMEIVTSRYTRTLVLQSYTRGKREALIVVRDPAREAGTATLRSDDGLWSYAPRADRLVRIPSTLFSDSWMGSHFTNDDLMRDTDLVRDYDTTLAWTQEGGRRLLRATLKPKPDAPVVWSRIVYVMEPQDYLPVRAEYLDGERIARTLTFTNPRVVDGRRVPHTLRMVPAASPDEFTLLEYRELRFGVEVDPGLFTQRALRRGVRP